MSWKNIAYKLHDTLINLHLPNLTLLALHVRMVTFMYILGILHIGCVVWKKPILAAPGGCLSEISQRARSGLTHFQLLPLWLPEAQKHNVLNRSKLQKHRSRLSIKASSTVYTRLYSHLPFLQTQQQLCNNTRAFQTLTWLLNLDQSCFRLDISSSLAGSSRSWFSWDRNDPGGWWTLFRAAPWPVWKWGCEG